MIPLTFPFTEAQVAVWGLPWEWLRDESGLARLPGLISQAEAERRGRILLFPE